MRRLSYSAAREGRITATSTAITRSSGCSPCLARSSQHRSEEIFLAGLWMLVKTGKTREALLRLEARHPGLPVDLRHLRVSYRPELLLLRADMSLDLDGTPPLPVIASWGRLQAFMEPGDELSRGLLYNSMAIGYLQADALVEARQLAEEARAAYERARIPYLVHFMHVHLADIALRQSRLPEAARCTSSAPAQMLRASGQAFNSEYAIIESLKSRLAFEQGRFEDCATDVRPLLDALVTGRQLAGPHSAGRCSNRARRALERRCEKRVGAARPLHACAEPTGMG